jgi:hypothetical protein
VPGAIAGSTDNQSPQHAYAAHLTFQMQVNHPAKATFAPDTMRVCFRVPLWDSGWMVHVHTVHYVHCVYLIVHMRGH